MLILRNPLFALSLKQGYILALSLILLLATSKFLATDLMILKQDHAAVVINLSGRQRMLSQRTAFYVSSYMLAQTQAEQSKMRQPLLETLKEFESNHKKLIHGDTSLNLKSIERGPLYDLYFLGEPSLDSLTQNYIHAAIKILENDGKGEEALESFSYIKKTGPSILLDKLDEVVFAHEKIARQDVQNIFYMQLCFWILTVFLLYLEAFFLFAPMVRRHEQALQELKRRKAKIKEHLSDLRQMTQIASHDLLEPLRKIIGFVERLELEIGKSLQDKERTYLKFIREGAFHMREVVLGLGSYSSVISSDLEVEQVHTESVLERAIARVKVEFPQSKLKIHYSDMPIILYNEYMLECVFYEMIKNALTYCNRKICLVNITVEENGDALVFRLSDNGIGIVPEFSEKIFMMFQRLHHKKDYSGVGMGLSIVKKIIELHGGKIWHEPNPDVGSSFFFTVLR